MAHAHKWAMLELLGPPLWLVRHVSVAWCQCARIRAMLRVAARCADDSPAQGQPDAGTCTEVVSADGLVQQLHERAQAAVDAGSTVRAMPVSRDTCAQCSFQCAAMQAKLDG